MKKFCLLILALLAGCAQQPSADDNALIITAFSTYFDTKATEAAFEAGDIIGLFMENNASNLRYETSDGSTWRGFGNIGEFKNGDNVTAYYPYNESAKNASAIEVSGGVDFMLTSATPITVEGNKASASLQFRHVLSKLVVSMERPEEINGVKTVSLDSIVAKNVFRKGTIDLASEKISGLTDKGDLKAFGTEIIVIPQTVQKIKLVFKMVGGTFDSLAYNTPMLLESGKETTLNATSNADLYFTSNLNLSSGEAQTDLPLSFYVVPGRTWTLTSSATWLTVEPKTGVGAATVKVNTTANTSFPRKVRTANLVLTDDKHAVVIQKPMQNYARVALVTIANIKWTTTNLTATTQGQTTGFTLCANPQDYGYFWKWGSVYAYDRVSGNFPSGHWGGLTTGAATYPTAQGHNYDYASIRDLGGNVGGPVGDPCAQLGAYRTPTHAQWQALVNSGKSSRTTYQGKNGCFLGAKATSCNNTTIQDGCIFLPVAGYRHCSNGVLADVDFGIYWASSVINSTESWHFYIVSNLVTPDEDYYRGGGFSVRCVAE